MGIVIATRTGIKENTVRTPPYKPCDCDGSLSPRCRVKISARAITTEAGKIRPTLYFVDLRVA